VKNINSFGGIMEIIKYLISASFITGTIVFIAKLAVGKIFDGLENKYKHKLNAELIAFESDKQRLLEAFKANQQKLLDENKIRYTRLHADRADVIVETYKRLVKLETKIDTFIKSITLKYDYITDISNIDNEFRESINEGYNNSIEELQEDMFCDFFYYVNENNIFFTGDLTESFNELNRNLNRMNILKGIAKRDAVGADELINPLKLVIEKIKKIEEEIQKEFRSLLGVK
jgi:hypothetical protein